jgi:hypothetical protein
MLISLGIDCATVGWHYTTPSGEKMPAPEWWHYDIHSFVWTLLNPIPDHTRNLMHAVIPTTMFLFGMLVTFIGIFLQFAAKRTTAHVNNILIKDRFIVGSLAAVMIINTFGFFVVLSTGSPILPRAIPINDSWNSSSSSSSAFNLGSSAPIFSSMSCSSIGPNGSCLSSA